MPALDQKKKRRALELRLRKKSFAEISRTLHMAPATLRNLEYGWIDRQGVQHCGWRHEIEKRWDEDDKAEIECGLALKEDRERTLKRLTQMAISKMESQFPAVTMASPLNWKTLVSEIQELIRLLSDEVDIRRDGSKGIASRMLTTLEDIRETYAQTLALEIEEAGPGRPSLPEEGETDDDTSRATGVE
jgi:hypothetical protein